MDDEPVRVRRRKTDNNKDPDVQESESEMDEKPKSERKRLLEANTYWLTRIVLLRSLCFVYFVAFLVALHQNRYLLGSKGLLPVPNFLRQIKNIANGDIWEMLQRAPTILWFLDWEQNCDLVMDTMVYTGLAISGFVVVTGCANMVMMFTLWLIYHSIANVGQTWYSFGWESQILETGFLAVFLCPLFTLRQVPRFTTPSIIIIWAFRWLIVRIMLGAGLIKIRGDKCWRDLTCMNYHYQTQPVPNPMAYYMHLSPEVFHKFEVASNHFIELVVPFFLLPFLPRRFRLVGGVIQVIFQVVLIISGNLSFLNWLTIIPSLACFDDKSLTWLFSDRKGSPQYKVWEIQQEEKTGRAPRITLGWRMQRVVHVGLGAAIAYLSLPIVQNLLSHRQIMNTSFDPLRIVNTYGAFGSITKERTEVILQGTYDGPNNPKAKWIEYEFKCKPGSINRRPCIISPYHYRLDWLMWFAAFGNYQEHPWLVHLSAKLLANDPMAETLIANNPFHGKTPPKWIRAEHYRYMYSKPGSQGSAKGNWWRRKKIGNYMPAISLETIKGYMKAMKWEQPLVVRPERKDTKKEGAKNEGAMKEGAVKEGAVKEGAVKEGVEKKGAKEEFDNEGMGKEGGKEESQKIPPVV